ncbi:MAG TPA: phosphopantetheine-binding protein [Symbiobacteriaceae bacterium]|nr:phosphopantetheine-binding protein [Symbiobacteriaceae bacterium]
MSSKQEALKVIREQLGDKSIGFNTTITEVSEEFDTGIEQLVETLESEFGVELSEELVVEVDTIGELCAMVARASKENDLD